MGKEISRKDSFQILTPVMLQMRTSNDPDSLTYPLLNIAIDTPCEPEHMGLNATVKISTRILTQGGATVQGAISFTYKTFLVAIFLSPVATKLQFLNLNYNENA